MNRQDAARPPGLTAPFSVTADGVMSVGGLAATVGLSARATIGAASVRTMARSAERDVAARGMEGITHRTLAIPGAAHNRAPPRRAP